jgi:cell division protein ZapA
VSDVVLQIGGRSYTVSCAPGEEAHVSGLGRMIDGKLAEMPGGTAHSETRGLLFAALMLADRVHELECAGATAGDGAATARLGRLAGRLERLAELAEAHGKA